MELLILLLIILLFFGAGRIPEVGRSLGRGMREFRTVVSEKSDKDDEPRERDESEEAPPPRGEVPPKEVRAQTEHEEVYETRRSVVDEFKSELDPDSGQDNSKRRASTEAGKRPQASHTEEQSDD